jgi:hypothetical protein
MQVGKTFLVMAGVIVTMTIQFEFSSCWITESMKRVCNHSEKVSLNRFNHRTGEKNADQKNFFWGTSCIEAELCLSGSAISSRAEPASSHLDFSEFRKKKRFGGAHSSGLCLATDLRKVESINVAMVSNQFSLHFLTSMTCESEPPKYFLEISIPTSQAPLSSSFVQRDFPPLC